MPWDVAEPGDAGGFEGDGGVEATGDGPVDDGLLLLVEQRDDLPLGPDRTIQPPIRVVQKPHHRRLLLGRGHWNAYATNCSVRKSISSDAMRLDVELRRDLMTL